MTRDMVTHQSDNHHLLVAFESEETEIGEFHEGSEL
jgi:hypothetical protein